MKRMITVLLALGMLALLLSACGAGSSPERVVKTYFEAVKAGDLEKAISCFQPSVQRQYEAATSLSDSLIGAFGVNIDSSTLLGGLVGLVNSDTYRDYEFQVSGVRQSGDTRAVVEVVVRIGGNETGTTTVQCVRIDGQWYLEK